MRPRMRSSVTDWLILLRHTALTKSAAPVSANCITVSHSELANHASYITGATVAADGGRTAI